MQWFEVLRKTIALLSRMYLVALICLGSWAVLPLAIGWTPTVVMSGSMMPNVQIGDILVAQTVNSTQKEELISTGHVLLATDPSHANKLVTHRVVNVIKGTGFITKGDANATADPTIVPLSNVQGIERLRIPMIGIPIQASRMGNFIPMIIFTVLTILAQLSVLHDRKIEKQATPQKPSLPVPSRAGKKEKNTNPTPTSKKTLFRLTSLTLTPLFVITLSVLFASSAAGFSAASKNNGNSFKATADFATAYKDSIIAEAPLAYYRLNETKGKEAKDSSDSDFNARYSNKGVELGEAGALTRNVTDKAVTLDGSQGVITSSSSAAGPQSFTAQIWFKTTSVRGGKLIGFGIGAANSSIVDRVLYMTNSGKLTFGIDTNTKKTIQTPLSYNDGTWHMATVTLTGLKASLYIDGKLASSGETTSAPTTATGFLVAGGGNFTGWTNQPTSSFFAGSLDEITIYAKALTAAQIAAMFGAA